MIDPVRRTAPSSGGAVSAGLFESRPRRIALLVVALGLVLMHHVVGAHQHTSSDPMPSAAAHVAGHPDSGAAGHASSGHEPQPAVAPTSPTAMLHHHPDEGGHDHLASVLHLCLAALAAAAAFAVVLALVARWWRFPLAPGAARAAVDLDGARSPPSSATLARLQVLRL